MSFRCRCCLLRCTRSIGGVGVGVGVVGGGGGGGKTGKVTTIHVQRHVQSREADEN